MKTPLASTGIFWHKLNARLINKDKLSNLNLVYRVCLFFFWLSPSWYLSIFPWCFKTKPLRQPALKIIFIYRWSRKVNAEIYSVKISPNLSLLSDEYHYRHFNNRTRQMYKLLSSSICLVSKYAAMLSCQPHGTDQYQPLFLVENIETRLSVDVRSSSTSHYKPLETLGYFKYKSMFTLSGEKLKL